MFFRFDHLVHFTKNPEEAAQIMIKHGFHAVKGGHHESWGTYNSLCHFGLPYIEFLGLEDLTVAQKVTHNTLISQVVDEFEQGEGFLRLAIRTDNIEEAARHFSSLGLHTIGPVEGERRREDGTLLKWAMLFIEEPGARDPYNYPFIIDWKVSDEGRATALQDLGLIAPHSQTQLTEIGIGTRDPHETLTNWSRLFHLTQPDQTLTHPLDDHAKAFTAQLGEVTIVFHSSNRDLTRPSFLKLAPALPAGKQEIMGGHYVFTI
ncbi:MAG TPA: VOC family protein [Sporolactobacillaceae bacterium]|nr:VOC family protein [Sporolactobacillaceae bacterium]